MPARAIVRGVSGSLLPGSFVAELRPPSVNGQPFARWWRHIESACGPATGIRAIVDLAAAPLFGMLGFRASAPEFGPRSAHLEIRPRADARAGVSPSGRALPLVVAPWAHRSPSVWRNAVGRARALGADWTVIFAPPYLQVIEARAHWSRQFLEFSLADLAADGDGFARLLQLAGADALAGAAPERSLRAMASAGRTFRDRVREDLQHGVFASLAALAPAATSRDEALAMVYRVLFLLFVESRDLVPWRHPLYRPAYSMDALCDRALTRPDAPGFWPALGAISRLLRSGCRTRALDVPPFNGHLFSRSAAPSLERRRAGPRSRRAAREDAGVARTLVELSTRASPRGREAIAYHDLGVEQLGAVYERVLGGQNRKQSGTFYTPRSLTEFVVAQALEPLVDGRRPGEILRLRVVDPAMGSGAFLVAACRFLAHAYERAAIDHEERLDHEVDGTWRAEARRAVAQHCLYGVDRNPTAVQLARLSLWLATLSAGKPLSFFDHRLRAGDALVGADPSALRHAVDRVGRARRAGARPTSLPLFDAELDAAMESVSASLAALCAEPDDSLDAVRRKETQWSRLSAPSSAMDRWRSAADLWCARWFQDRPLSVQELRAAVDGLTKHDRTVPGPILDRWIADAHGARTAHAFFHWPLEFADVFFDAAGRRRPEGGFDAVIGNPPWEMLRRDHGGDAGAAGPLARFIRDSGIYRSCGRGHVNLYQPFVERALDLVRPGGRVGLVVPWGLASDDGAAGLRARLLDRCAGTTIAGFDNAAGIFPVHRGLRFMAVTTTACGSTGGLRMTCGITSAEHIEDRASVTLSRGLLARAGGPARRLPDVRAPEDVALIDALTRRFAPVGSKDGWGAAFGRELNVTDDRGLFGPSGLLVIEGKHIQPFTVDAAAARFRIPAPDAARALPDRAFERPRLAYRDVSAVTNRHALIAAVIPAGVVTTHTLFCLKSPIDIAAQHFLCACFNSSVMNRFVRLLMGGHLTTSLVEMLPVPRWTGAARQRRIARLAALAGAGCGGPAQMAQMARLIDAEFGSIPV